MPLSVEQIARVVHEANRAYCKALGDDSQAPWDIAPDWQRTSLCEGVQAVIKGTARTPEDLHLAWCKRKAAEGWRYGPKKDPAEHTHPCLVPYAELPEEQRRKDHLLRAVVSALTAPVSDVGGVAEWRTSGGTPAHTFYVTIDPQVVALHGPEVAAQGAAERLHDYVREVYRERAKVS